MINRAELKTKAKAILKKKYIYLLLVAILYSFCIINFSVNTSITANGIGEKIYYIVGIGFFDFTFDPFDPRIVTLISLITILTRIFLAYPMEYSVMNYYKRAITDTEKGTLANGYKNGNLKRSIFTFIYRDLIILLWALLLVIPGIYKAYEYRLVPYLTEDYPDKTPSEILKMSKKMMYGNKLNALVLDISFLGWYLLSSLIGAFTFGFGDYLVLPYINQTNAELYVFLKETSEAADNTLDVETN